MLKQLRHLQKNNNTAIFAGRYKTKLKFFSPKKSKFRSKSSYVLNEPDKSNNVEIKLNITFKERKKIVNSISN